MAATSNEHADSLSEDPLHGDDASRAGGPARVIQFIPVSLAAVYGALLGGLVAFLEGSAGVAAFGVQLERVGFFRNGLIETVFAARSVLAVTLVTLVGAALGALAWSAGALVWNRVVASGAVGRGSAAIRSWWRRHGLRRATTRGHPHP